MPTSHLWTTNACVIVLGLATSFAVNATPQSIEVPSKAIPIPNVKTIDIFKQGVYHFYEDQYSFFQLGKRQGSTYLLKTNFSKATPHQFSYGGNRDWVVVNGKLQKPSNVRQLRVLGHNQVAIQSSARDSLIVSLQAYDVSERSIQSFLKNHSNRPTTVAQKISSGYRFSQGAIAYVPTFQTVTDKVVIPNKDVLSGPKTLDHFISVFSNKIPNCLNYERRSGSQPYAIRFTNRKGNNGDIEIFEANRASAICETNGKRVAMGKYQLKTINGTKVMALTFPQNIDSRDVGIKTSERDAVNFAFVEVRSPKRQVLPGLIVNKGKNFHDFQYRFNAVAAKDIERAQK